MINRRAARMQVNGRNKGTEKCSLGRPNKPASQSATKISGIFGPSAIHTQMTPLQKATSAIPPNIRLGKTMALTTKRRQV